MTDSKRLFSQLTAFLQPLSDSAGLRLRPFSIAFFSMTRLAGLAIGSKEFATLSEEDKTRQLSALLVMQTTNEDAALAKSLREAAGDFEKFYWDFVFPRAREISVESLAVVEDSLAAELPAIEAAQVEVVVPPSMKGGAGDKEPPNS